MRYFTILIFTTLWVLNSYAQEFGTHWVSYPFPNDSSEILYRKIYHLDQKPLKAEISMASGGNTRLYINERNVTPSIFNEGARDSILLMQSTDISRYLKRARISSQSGMHQEEQKAKANNCHWNSMAGILTLFLFIIKQTKHGGANR